MPAKLPEEERIARRRARERAYRAANKEKINAQKTARRRERKAEDPEYAERLRAHSRKYYQENLVTGYGRGRPRIGEERPFSKNADNARKWREDNQQWADYNRMKQTEWVANNPERRKEIVRDSLARKKARAQQQ